MKTRMFMAALAATLVASPVLAQRHADIVYMQQQKAKQAQQLAAAAERQQEVASAPAAEPASKPAKSQADDRNAPSR